MKRMTWFLIAIACAMWVGCGSDDSPSDDGNNAKPVAINGALVIPSGWAGKWQVTLTFRDCTTNAIRSQEVVTSQVCPGDTLFNPFAPVFENCTGTRTGNHLEASCSAQSSSGACQVTLDVDFTMDVNGNQLTGSGTINTTGTPACLNGLVSFGCQKVGISGTRLSSSTAGCDTLSLKAHGFLK